MLRCIKNIPLLEVNNLQVTFSSHGGKLHAVRGISFDLEQGEALGIVGESGSGKSAAVHAINQLSGADVSGKILFQGKEITKPGDQIGMVFQDPMSSLNPTMKIGAQITEGLIYHKILDPKLARVRALELLHLVGIPDPKIRIDQYPHEFSGGMRQRVLLAIALACYPKLLIADEPTTALDVVTQEQILDLIKSMQKHFQMALLLITHDFNVIARTCDKVIVMYAGKVIERGEVTQVLKSPKHPYTQMLLNSLPKPGKTILTPIEGSPPNLLAPIQGCSFKERCPHRDPKCNEEPSGPVACWRAQ